MKQIKLILFLFPFWAIAQHQLTGVLIDQKKQPVAFANSLLFKMPDSVFYKGTTSDENGRMSFTDLASGDYHLIISSVGYSSLSRKLTLDQSMDLNQIVIKESQEQLDAVTITAKKPTVERRPDRLIFKVENTSVSSGNAVDILKATPGIFEMNGSYLVQNQAAVVYINNKRVYLTQDELNQLLNGYSGDHVKSVEVITNPPAQYDADGAAVININTSSNVSIGYKGAVTGNWTIDTFAKYQVGLSQFYKNNWLNVYANYNYNPRKDLLREESQIGFFNTDGTRNQRWFMEFDNVDRTAAHTVNTTIDIDVSNRSRLSLTGNITLNDNQEANNNVQTFILQNGATQFSGFDTNSQLERDKTTGFFTAGWLQALGDKGATINLEGSYVFTHGEAQQDVFSNFYDENNVSTRTNRFGSQAELDIDIYSLKADYSTSINQYMLTAGVKYTDIETLSNQDFFDRNAGNVLDPNNSDLYDYGETIYAVYSQLQRDWSKWSMSLGLRVEQTDVTGDSRSLGIVNTQDYVGWFPNLAITNQVNDNNALTLSYKRSVERPRYSSLNPFNYFINDANSNAGNPNLQPAFTNKVSLAWNLKNTYFFDLYYKRTDDMLEILPFQNNTDLSIVNQDANINYEYQYSLDFTTYKYLTNSWLAYLSSSFYYMENEIKAIESGNVNVKQNTTGAYINLYNQITLNKKGTWNMEVEAGYLSSILFGSYEFENMLSSSVGVTHSMWQNRGILTFKLNDLFLGQNQEMRSRYLNQDYRYLALPETQTVSLGFTYKFGNFRLDNRSVEDPEEKQRTEKKSLGF